MKRNQRAVHRQAMIAGYESRRNDRIEVSEATHHHPERPRSGWRCLYSQGRWYDATVPAAKPALMRSSLREIVMLHFPVLGLVTRFCAFRCVSSNFSPPRSLRQIQSVYRGHLVLRWTQMCRIRSRLSISAIRLSPSHIRAGGLPAPGSSRVISVLAPKFVMRGVSRGSVVRSRTPTSPCADSSGYAVSDSAATSDALPGEPVERRAVMRPAGSPMSHRIRGSAILCATIRHSHSSRTSDSDGQ